METWYFSELAYPYLPDDSEYESIRVSLPNRYYDPKKGADLWNRLLDEWSAADELGLNVMVNEHHQTPTCMSPAAPIITGILARQTSRARILLLGNPIATRRDPVRVAEEMAVVDNISRGRLEVGFVRSVPYEVWPANASPVGMADRMWEAHDLIKKAWTTHDGPFSWESKHFHYRYVNIWPRPYQQPHPPIWTTALTPSSTKKAAENGYVVGTFLAGFDLTGQIFDTYRNFRAQAGLPQLGLDRFAYSALVYTGDTDEEGLRGAEKMLWYFHANKVPAHFSGPPGYVPVQARVAMARAGGPANRRGAAKMTLEELIDRGLVFAGSPDTVYGQIKRFYDRVGGFGHLLAMGQAGPLEHDETMASMRLFANEVNPRLKELSGTPAEGPAAEVASAGRLVYP